MARITLDMWIQDALMDTRQDGKCTAISCVHKIGSADDEIYAVKIGENTVWDPQELANIFMHKAQSAVQDIPNTQSFYLYAFYNGRREPQSKHHFRIDGGADLGHGQTEPATKEGSLAQGMRLAESNAQFFARQSLEIFRLALESNKELAHNYREVVAENREYSLVLRDMLMQRATENHQLKMTEIAAVKSAEERALIMRLGPALVNTIAGKDVFPMATADTALIESLIEVLDETTIGAMQSKLPPALYAALASRAAEHWKAKRAAVALAAQASEDRKDPVLDVNTEAE